MTDAAAGRLLDGEAWDDFCESLKRTGRMIDEIAGELDELDRAEWYRCLSRYVRGGLERYLEGGEATRPRFRDLAWRHTINFASPMQDHLFIEFPDGAADYRITGNRGSVPYFVTASWRSAEPPDFGARSWAALGVEGLKQFDPAILSTLKFLESGDMRFDDAGNFSFVVGRDKPAGDEDWLPITPDCVGLLVRWVFSTRENVTPPRMWIERLDGAAPTPVDAAHVSRGLAKTAQATLGYAELIRSWWNNNLGKRPNTILFSQAVYLSNGGVPDRRHHGFGSWARDRDEALVVRFTPPACQYWTFQLCNIWQENFDNYEDGQGFLHKSSARLQPDGSVLAVIAESDPGIGGHWLDPYGHVHGGWSLRLIKTDGDPPQVTAHRVKLDALKRSGLVLLETAQPILSGTLVD
jgi:hypothetical protein